MGHETPHVAQEAVPIDEEAEEEEVEDIHIPGVFGMEDSF
jgi:hypothetical protein